MRFCQLNASTISSFLESIEFITSQISIWGATLTFFFYTYDEPISIHAPHTGSDISIFLPRNTKKISIHAPHTGSDCTMGVGGEPTAIFQSTLPIRGATLC